MSVELQYLRVFYEVAKQGSFSSAGRVLRVTQPSVSRSVQNLEGALGRKLFQRQARGIALTEEGQEVYQRCHRIFEECAAIERDPALTVPRLRVAASENLCIHVIPNALAGWSPTPQLELRSGTAEEVTRFVLGGDSDVGYCYHAAKMSGIHCVAIASVEFWLIAAARRSGQKVSLRTLREMPFIGSISKNYSGPYAAKSLIAELGLAVSDARISCNSQEAQLAMVEQGLGFSLVPWFIARELVTSRRIQKISAPRKVHAPLYRLSRAAAGISVYSALDNAIHERVGG